MVYFNLRGRDIYNERGQLIEYGIGKVSISSDGTINQLINGLLIWPVYQEKGFYYMNVLVPGKNLQLIKLSLGFSEVNSKFALYSGFGTRLPGRRPYNAIELKNINQYLRIGDRVMIRLIVGLKENYSWNSGTDCDESCSKNKEYLLHEQLGKISPRNIRGILNTLDILR